MMEHVSNLAKPDLFELGETAPTGFISQKFDVDEVWKSVKEQLRLYVSEASIKSWYTNVILEKIDAGIAQFSCDTPYKREWIDSNNRAILKKILLSTTGQNLEISIGIRQSSIDNQTNQTDEPRKERKYEYLNTDQTSLFTPQQPKQVLNPKYTFDSYIIGMGNQLAHAVAEAVVEAPGTSYNPVFFYGGTGVGKTHLMLAVGNKVLEKFNGKKVVYSPIESFLNEMIDSIRKRSMDNFRKKYREIDVLIIDDIQFIGNYPKTQDEIFNTFNALYMEGKQIMMASDRLPRDIPNITDRLRSRFEGGMIVDIQPPDLETRIAIIQQKVESSKAVIPWDIINFIAANIESNIRELEGSITKVISVATYSGKMPTIEEVATMLKVDITSKRQRIKPKKIITVVAEVYETNPKDILGEKRNAYIALARQVVMYLLREELKLPLEKVAEEVKRKDHTTVIHACEKVARMAKENVSFREKLDRCRNMVRE